MVDGCWSKLVNVVSGVLQGSVLGPLLFLMFTCEFFYILENKLIGRLHFDSYCAIPRCQSCSKEYILVIEAQ